MPESMTPLVAVGVIWKEFSLLHMHYGLMHDDFVSLTQNAVECSFANDSIKQELIKLCS